jgi:DNA-binding response OmpR family regulator
MARTMTTSTKGLRALVLDADPASLRSLAWSLEARFISVCTAPDGTRGLDLLLEELLSLDVLVIDAALPDRDALAFAELIRRAGGERDLAIVVVADSPAPELRMALLTLGVDAIIERSEGPDAAALAAVAAVASRASRSLEDEDEAPAAANEPEPAPEPEPVTLRFALPFARGWSMLPA